MTNTISELQDELLSTLRVAAEIIDKISASGATLRIDAHYPVIAGIYMGPNGEEIRRTKANFRVSISRSVNDAEPVDERISPVDTPFYQLARKDALE